MAKPTGPIAGVMVHVPDVPAAFAWYQRAFPHAIVRHITAPIDFTYLDVDGVQLEIVPADEKVASGAAGTLVDWYVPDFEAALAHMQSIGATLYRGPGDIENGKRMCKLRDPWGNCIGLRGPSSR
ncbi:MAG: VOC family protein [Burkholderiaceae bacterium]